MTPQITGTNFVIAVSDLQASAAFYRDVLGFDVRTIPDPGLAVLHLRRLHDHGR